MGCFSLYKAKTFCKAMRAYCCLRPPGGELQKRLTTLLGDKTVTREETVAATSSHEKLHLDKLDLMGFVGVGFFFPPPP